MSRPRNARQNFIGRFLRPGRLGCEPAASGRGLIKQQEMEMIPWYPAYHYFCFKYTKWTWPLVNISIFEKAQVNHETSQYFKVLQRKILPFSPDLPRGLTYASTKGGTYETQGLQTQAYAKQSGTVPTKPREVGASTARLWATRMTFTYTVVPR